MALRLTFNRVYHLLRPNSSFYSFHRTMAEHPVKAIEFNDLKSHLDEKKITLIDVREPKELKEDGKIPDSMNIPLGEIEEAFKLPGSAFQSKYGFPKPEKSEMIAITCRSGKRATNAYNKIMPLGYENALVYLGSFLDWVKKGGAVEK